jgi:hypothetical protein
MVDISAFSDPIVEAIYEHYEKRNDSEEPRGYLGGSIIGKECKRAIWYDFRMATRKRFSGRMMRLFETGHLAEPRLVKNLRDIGCQVWDCDPATGKQFSYKDVFGHMSGHLDGVAKYIPTGGKTPHLLEFKTHSAKSFKELKEKGVKIAKPQHYAQMIVYCGWANLTRALYMAVNKDTDELYTERLEFNPVVFHQLIAKAEEIIFSDNPPAKISEDPKFFVCNMCDHKDVCHNHKVPALSCRTCVHATPERTGDARWSCAKVADKNISSIPIHVQRVGCKHHLPLPFLLTYAEPIDAGQDWIEFKRKDTGATFIVLASAAEHPSHKPPGFVYNSHEISAATDHKVICNQEIEAFRTTFGAAIIS